uniref:Serine/threonine-protein kinase-like protein CCR4 n=1 Tax=Aegilops tauschii TaxID=37682 RepID=M8C5Q3_AEGTA
MSRRPGLATSTTRLLVLAFLLAVAAGAAPPSPRQFSTVAISHTANSTLVCALIIDRVNEDGGGNSKLQCKSMPDGGLTSYPPARIPFTTISPAGRASLCALMAPVGGHAAMRWWSFSEEEQARRSRPVPEEYTHTTFVSIEADGDTVCAVMTSNYSVVCWGNDGRFDGRHLVYNNTMPGACAPKSNCSCNIVPDSGRLCGTGGGLGGEELAVGSPCKQPPNAPRIVVSNGSTAQLGDDGGDAKKKKTLFVGLGVASAGVLVIIVAGLTFYVLASRKSDKKAHATVRLGESSSRRLCRDGDVEIMRGERILVFEFMPHGALHDHLHGEDAGSGHSPLFSSWEARLRVALDAARGVEYLHCYAVPPIIHRDIKPSNILLDDDWTAKVSDFGLSLVSGASASASPTTTSGTAGTVGYRAPEYYRLQELTERSDVYSFGVVLLELVTGRKAIHRDQSQEGSGSPRNVIEFAVPAVEGGNIDKILDSRVPAPRGHEVEAVARVAKIGAECVRPRGRGRPVMSEGSGHQPKTEDKTSKGRIVSTFKKGREKKRLFQLFIDLVAPPLRVMNWDAGTGRSGTSGLLPWNDVTGQCGPAAYIKVASSDP